MLKFKICFLILLIIACLTGYDWLYNLKKYELPYEYHSPIIPFLKIQQKEIILSSEDSYFKPHLNYHIFAIEPYETYYKCQKDHNISRYTVYVKSNDNLLSDTFTLEIKEPEVIIKEIIKTEPNIPIIKNETVTNNIHPVDQKPYINGLKDLSLPLNSDLHSLNQLLSTGISSNYPISIDYSEVNLSAIGDYPVIYTYGELSQTIIVHVY